VGRGCFNGTEDIWFVFVLWIDGSGMEEVMGRVKGYQGQETLQCVMWFSR